MTQYNIVSTDEFHQPNPAFVCKNWALNLVLSEQQGYRVKCRNPRCSLGCYQDWRQKQSYVLRRLFQRYLPSDVKTYRGCLKLHDNATRDDHKAIVTKYLRALKWHSAKHNAIIEVHLTAHITGRPNNMHYDLLVYSGLPKTMLRRIAKSAWRNVGGLYASVPEMESEDERIKAIKYTTKDTTEARKEYVHLPSSNGFHLTRYSSNFWQGHSVESLWSELKLEWFPPTENTAPETNDAPIMNSKFSDTSMASFSPSHDDQIAYKVRDKRLRDIAQSYMRQFAPKTPDKAMTLHALSTKLSIPAGWLQNLVDVTEGVHRTLDNRYFMPALE